jgi:dienelactone hydrolase
MADQDPVFTGADIDPLRRKLYEAYDHWLEAEARRVYAERGKHWQRDFSSPEAYVRSVAPNRQRLLAMIGGWPWPRGPLNARLERFADTDTYTADRVFYTSFASVEVDAILLCPKGRGPFPAVLVQHGVNHTPEQICGFTAPEEWYPYNRIGLRLVQHGYMVIAPRMIGGFGADRFNVPDVPWLRKTAQGRAQNQVHRKAVLIGQTIQGLEYYALSRAIDFLETVPAVKKDRIGMYGLSRGGRAALWLGALDQRLQAVVSSCWFNERFTKMLVREEKYGPFIDNTSEFQFLPGLLCEFADSDIASLICPRAFFVEDGKGDKAVYWESALATFGEVEAVYKRLGIPEKCGILIHAGGHETEPREKTTDIQAVQFLDRWLRG